VIQLSDQKVWAFRTGTLVSSDHTSSSPSGDSSCTQTPVQSSQCSDSTSTPRKTESGNSCKRLREIPRSYQKLWPFRTGTLVSSDETSSSPSSDSTSSPRKTASGNSCKSLREIQRSDQKLWPFRTGTPVSSDETSSSPSGDSTSTLTKTASGNSSKILRVIQRSDQKSLPFRTATHCSRATRPPPHRGAIQHLLQGKQRLETPVNK